LWRVITHGVAPDKIFLSIFTEKAGLQQQNARRDQPAAPAVEAFGPCAPHRGMASINETSKRLDAIPEVGPDWRPMECFAF
jgi:hypothetical protein